MLSIDFLRKRKKNCITCFDYNDKDFEPTENCVGYKFIETEKKLNDLATILKEEGYNPIFKENCI